MVVEDSVATQVLTQIKITINEYIDEKGLGEGCR